MSERRRRFETQALPHLDAAYNFARWLVRPPLEADDIVQEAMLRAYRAFDTLKGQDVKPWLMTIVRNCFLSAAAQAHAKATVPLPADSEIGAGDLAMRSDGPDPERAAMDAEQRRQIELAIGALPDEFREVLILREMEDLSYREIAAITGAPMGTVMSRLARARGLLKAQCDLAEGREGP
jgi:RNA polymerase sigma-70 factor, ECF subfamily